MGSSPMGVLQLLDSTQVTVKRKASLFSRKYSVATDHGGALKVKSSSNTFHMKDYQGQQIAEFDLKDPWFKAPTMSVRLTRCKALTVKPKGSVSRSTLIMDESDQQVLRVKHTRTFWSGKEYKILGLNGIEVGSIRKDWTDYDLLYPLDLDVRYKTALIATIIYNDIMDQRQAAQS
ncbi:hypothetical protein O0L34_g14880 [Tuta absoluta]|nr:hypothetical protein O0L34_g14880 [Tuta absoluta]